MSAQAYYNNQPQHPQQAYVNMVEHEMLYPSDTNV